MMDVREHEDALDFQDLAGIFYVALFMAFQDKAGNQAQLGDIVRAYISQASTAYRQMDMRDRLNWRRGINNDPWAFSVSAAGLLPVPSNPENN